MKVILQKSVDKLGDPGDIAEVADGYARNYLIPRGMAIRAEKGALKQAETLKRGHNARLSKQKVEFEALASKLIAAGAQLVEVLPQPEFEEEHLPGSVNIPLKTLDAETTRRLERERNDPIPGDARVGRRMTGPGRVGEARQPCDQFGSRHEVRHARHASRRRRIKKRCA